MKVTFTGWLMSERFHCRRPGRWSRAPRATEVLMLLARPRPFPTKFWLYVLVL